MNQKQILQLYCVLAAVGTMLFFTPQAVHGVAGDVQLDLSSGGQIIGTAILAGRITDSANASYYLDPAADPSLIVAGSVGIGTTNPTGNLSVVSPALTDALVRIVPANYATEYDSRLFLGESDTNGMTFEYDGVANIGYIGMNNTVDPTGAWSKRIQMSRTGTEVAFMAGSVGIGTTAPGGALDIASAAVTAGYWLDGKAALTGESADNWLRLNQSSSWTNGVYSPGLIRADGGFQVDGITAIDASNTWHYAALSGAYDKFGKINASGFGIDANYNATYDLLVYDGGDIYTGRTYLGYGGTATIATYDTNENLAIMPNGTGSVGIGNIAPSNKLHVTGNIGATGWIGAGCESGCETSGGYALMYADGSIVNTSTITSTGVVNANGGLSQDGFNIINGSDTWLRTNGDTGWYNSSYGVGLYATDTSWIRAYPASTYFRAQYIYQDGPAGYVSSINGALAANYIPKADGSYRITNGHIYDSATGQISVGLGTGTLGSPGDLALSRSGGTTGALFLGNGTTYSYVFFDGTNIKTNTSFNPASDRRIKSDVAPLAYGLKEIMLLEPKKYQFHNILFDKNGNIEVQQKAVPSIGLIAQDIFPIMPEIVGKPKDENKELWSLNYDGMSVVLINAIKEQQTQITSLKSITTDFISKFKEGLIETKKLIVDGVDILKKLNELSAKVESQQRQIEELKKTVEELKKK